MWPFKTNTTTATALPIAVALAAPKPALTQLDRVEDKLDWLTAKFKHVKTATVGLADEDIADLKAKIQAATDAATALNTAPVVVAAPVVVSVATPMPLLTPTA